MHADIIMLQSPLSLSLSYFNLSLISDHIKIGLQFVNRHLFTLTNCIYSLETLTNALYKLKQEQLKDVLVIMSPSPSKISTATFHPPCLTSSLWSRPSWLRSSRLNSSSWLSGSSGLSLGSAGELCIRPFSWASCITTLLSSTDKKAGISETQTQHC